MERSGKKKSRLTIGDIVTWKGQGPINIVGKVVSENESGLFISFTDMLPNFKKLPGQRFLPFEDEHLVTKIDKNTMTI